MQHIIVYKLISSVIKETIFISNNSSIIIFMVDLLPSNHSSRPSLSEQEGNS